MSDTDLSSSFAVDPRTCIRCAACATVSPGHFTVDAGPARLLRPPANARETRACLAASALCPTHAVKPPGQWPEMEGRAHPSEVRPLYPELAEVAEGVRWKIRQLPWGSFEAARATPALRAIVREMAYSEQTTFSATQRFMQAFGDDADFTQWVSVWFYEETRHPMALLRWLDLAGETMAPDFVSRGRVSAPFMKSRIGTLVTNVISEIMAAHAYEGLSRASPEPLLAVIARRIAADEARHSASFFAYARAALARAERPERERLDALKVLHFWVNESSNVSHPVNQSMEKFRAMGAGVDLSVSFAAPTEQICRAIGLLTGVDIPSPDVLSELLVEHTARVHAGA
jgi:ferredoxin